MHLPIASTTSIASTATNTPGLCAILGHFEKNRNDVPTQNRKTRQHDSEHFSSKGGNKSSRSRSVVLYASVGLYWAMENVCLPSMIRTASSGVWLATKTCVFGLLFFSPADCLFLVFLCVVYDVLWRRG